MAELYIPIWMRGTSLEQIYIDEWIETGDTTLAREAVRESPDYDSYFAGNRREDGTVRYDESTYRSIVESYEDTLLSINVNPDLFGDQFAGLIAGDVSPSEFASRVNTVYQRVIDAVPEVRQQMNEYYEIGLTTEAIISSYLDPDIGSAILEKRIAVSEVGAEASRRNFQVGKEFANLLYEAGTDTASEAAQFFSLAEGALPTLGVLAARHNDPDDDFTLEEFAAAQLFGDPTQRRRTRLLLAQERADFAGPVGSAALRSDRGTLAGGLTGLERA